MEPEEKPVETERPAENTEETKSSDEYTLYYYTIPF